MTDSKEVYKLRWLQRNLDNPASSGDWYEETGGQRVYHDLPELIEHCRLRNKTWLGTFVYFVGVHELIEGKPDSKGRSSKSAGKMLREIHPAEFDTIAQTAA